jgi:hypothetical protein
MPVDVSVSDFLYNLSIQVPGYVLKGETVSLKIEVLDKDKK